VDYLTDRLGANLDGVLAEYAVLSEEALVPVTEPPLLRGNRDPALRRGDRLGSADRAPSSDCWRHGLDAGFGGRFGLCAAIRPAFGCPSDRDDLDRGKSRAAEGAGASEVINYSETPDWDEKARELTDGRGVDCIVEISVSAPRLPGNTGQL
jgi:hypothetical protein